jgi:hypothetical protein
MTPGRRHSRSLSSGQPTEHASGERPVYVFGLRVGGLPDLPASSQRPAAASSRSVALKVVGSAGIAERWRDGQASRVIDYRFSDGSLELAVDASPVMGYRIEEPPYGTHLVSSDGTEVFLPGLEAPDWSWQRLLFSRTLPIAAALQGLALFHVSAVRIGDHAVGVSAPSRIGKSSTATHLIDQGAEFFTDDVLAMEVVSDAVFTFAGPQFSSVEAHEIHSVAPGRRQALGGLLGGSGKQHLRPPSSETSLPLGVLYLLERTADVMEVHVDALDESAIAPLLGSGFIRHLDIDGGVLRHLDLCARMATGDRVYRVSAPVHGSAASVATVLMEHARARLSRASG